MSVLLSLLSSQPGRNVRLLCRSQPTHDLRDNRLHHHSDWPEVPDLLECQILNNSIKHKEQQKTKPPLEEALP